MAKTMSGAGDGLVRLHAEDPAPLLEAAFRRIGEEAMAGLPILHPALAVEAIGFGRWRGDWLGVLVTPWFMNLVLVPGPGGQWQRVAPGERRFVRFPSGDYAFLGGHEPEVGEFQSCSLFSPMDRFHDQDEVRLVARAALAALFAAPAAAAPAADVRDAPQTASPARPMSKREFLGTLLGRRGAGS